MALTFKYTISCQVLDGSDVILNKGYTNSAIVTNIKDLTIIVPASETDFEFDIGDVTGFTHIYLTCDLPLTFGINATPALPLDDAFYISTQSFLGTGFTDVTLHFENDNDADATCVLVLA